MTGPTFTEAFEDWHSPNVPTYEQAVDRAQSAVSAAITLEQELAAANAEVANLRELVAAALPVVRYTTDGIDQEYQDRYVRAVIAAWTECES